MIINIKPYFHPLAQRFFRQMNNLGYIIIDKKRINNFIVGVSKLLPNIGEYTAFPLILNQNTNKNTIYGFNNVGKLYFGNLLNGLTWNNTGFNFNGSQGITTTLMPPLGSNSRTIFCVGNDSECSRSIECMYVYGNDAVNGLMAVWYQSGPGNNLVDYGGGSNINYFNKQNKFFSITGRHNNNTGISSLLLNGISRYNKTISPNTIGSYPLSIGYSQINNGRYYNGIISFIMCINKAITDDENYILHNLYKSTLGENLSF